MITINIADDFSKETGARYYSNGKFSGEQFFKELLFPKFDEAVRLKVKLKVILDGGAYASSFLNESFRLLTEKYSEFDINVYDHLIIISDECPQYNKHVQIGLAGIDSRKSTSWQKAILRTNDYEKGYAVVTVIKNPISKKNSLAMVVIDRGYAIKMTGGILCEYHPETIKVLNTMSPKEQWDWLSGIRLDVKVY